MRNAAMLVLFLLVAALAAWTLLEGRRKPPAGPRSAPAMPEPEPDPEPHPPLDPVLKTLPDASGWERHETLGGLFSVPVPPGWAARDQRDRIEPARLSTGFMVAASLEDTRSGLFFYPYLPLLSAGSSEVRAMLEAYRGPAPTQVGLILYDHPTLGPVLSRLRWPFLTVQGPTKVIAALENPWIFDLFSQKYGIAKPEGFTLSAPTDLRRGLAAARLCFSLGPDLENLRAVEGLAFLGTARPDPVRGGWGLLLVFLQAPEGRWAEVAPTLQAILLGLRYDPQAHLAAVGPERAGEVALFRDCVPRLGRFDLDRLREGRER